LGCSRRSRSNVGRFSSGSSPQRELDVVPEESAATARASSRSRSAPFRPRGFSQSEVAGERAERCNSKQSGYSVTEGIQITALADWPRTRLRATVRPATPPGTPVQGWRGCRAGRSGGSGGGGAAHRARILSSSVRFLA
jgi:hypothetical protein